MHERPPMVGFKARRQTKAASPDFVCLPIPWDVIERALTFLRANLPAEKITPEKASPQTQPARTEAESATELDELFRVIEGETLQDTPSATSGTEEAEPWQTRHAMFLND